MFPVWFWQVGLTSREIWLRFGKWKCSASQMSVSGQMLLHDVLTSPPLSFRFSESYSGLCGEDYLRVTHHQGWKWWGKWGFHFVVVGFHFVLPTHVCSPPLHTRIFFCTSGLTSDPTLEAGACYSLHSCIGFDLYNRSLILYHLLVVLLLWLNPDTAFY